VEESNKDNVYWYYMSISNSHNNKFKKCKIYIIYLFLSYYEFKLEVSNIG